MELADSRGAEPLVSRPYGRRDVRLLRFAADPEVGFVQVFHWRLGHAIAHGGGEPLKTRATGPAHAGKGRRHKVRAEQIGHQRGQTLLGQQLIVRRTRHESRETRAIPSGTASCPDDLSVHRSSCQTGLEGY